MVKQFFVDAAGDSDLELSDSDEPIIDDDEEIDEDTAFTAEDYLKYGDVGSKRKREEEDDFSDEDDENLTNITDLLGADSDESEEDQTDPKQHRKLLKSIQSIDSDHPPRKKFKKLQSELYEESEYNLRPSAARVEIEDLLPSLEDSKGYGELKKKLEKLNEKKSSLDKPLSEPVKDRISRKAAYIKANKDISRWQTTIQRNRIAEQLQFPMNTPQVPFASNKTITKEFKPSTELEGSIAGILEAGGIDEKKITEFEELAEKQLTREEVERKRAELAKMRSLMLYKEMKSKHQKKIKSRKYRKMVRKGQEREKLSLEELAVVDPEKYQKLLEERELERIKERLTLKHSNTSKWAKRAIKQKDLNVRQAVHEQVQKGEALRKKMTSMHDSDSESEDYDEEETNLEEEYDRMMEETGEKGIHGLKFMKRAAEKQKQQFLESLQPDEDDDGEEELVGRRKYGPSTMELKRQEAEKKQKRMEEMKAKRKSRQSPLTNFKVPDKKAEEKKDESTPGTQDGEEKNPWMNLKGGTKMQKKAKEMENAQVSSNAPEVIQTTIDTEAVISVSEKKLEAANLLSNQKEIVEEAFAGLDVYKEFEEEKNAILNEPDDEPVDTQDLPGWGSWAGEGVKMSRKQKYRLKKKKLQREKEVQERKAKRADAKLQNVIINENADTKFQQFQVSKLPYEFGNRRQYERSIAQPIGPEWNTLSSHSLLTKPAVVVRPGLTIDPLEAPSDPAKKTSKRKPQRKPLR